MHFEFAQKSVKIKSSWFDHDSVISKIGVDGFLFYIQLYRFHVNGQCCPTFITNLKAIRQHTGLSKGLIVQQLKSLESYQIIKTNVQRWGTLDQGTMIIIQALDTPETEREPVQDQEFVDRPLTPDDFYISLDMKMIQEYLDHAMTPCSIAMYALLIKFNTSSGSKNDISIKEMSERLNVSRTTIQKSIQEMNRAYLMYSAYIPNNKMRNSNNSKAPVKFEHYIFKRYRDLEQYRFEFKKRIDANIKKWNETKKVDR